MKKGNEARAGSLPVSRSRGKSNRLGRSWWSRAVSQFQPPAIRVQYRGTGVYIIQITMVVGGCLRGLGGVEWTISSDSMHVCLHQPQQMTAGKK